MRGINFKSGIFIILFFALVIFIVVFFNVLEVNKESSEYEDISLLGDSMLFFSVSNNINKLFDYVESSDSKALVSIMDSDYLDSNNLTISNIVSKYKSKYLNLNYYPVDMYVVSSKENYKFYTKGYLRKDSYDSANVIVGDAYFALNLNLADSVFSLEVLSSDTYNNCIKGKNIKFKSISINDNNTFEYGSVTDENLAVIYFNDFYNNILHNSKYAYNSITNETKKKYFSSYNDFVNKINSNYFNKITLEEYSVNDNVYTCKDNKGNIYSFSATGVMNYSVSIEFNV